MTSSTKLNVPLLDLKAQYASIRGDIQAAIQTVCESQLFILGETVARFETEMAAYCRCKHAIGVSSGTDALLAGLMALGVGAGDEVVVPSFTFFATAGTVARLGARPVFVDIEPRTFNIDPGLIERRITKKTRAILPVDLYGQMAEMRAIDEIAKKHGIPVVEDAAQAIGAEHHDRRAGQYGTLTCFSFFPTKNLGGFGDGGLITTNDDALAVRCREVRTHGSQTEYHHQFVGGNFRLDALQAAVLSVKLKYLDRWLDARRAVAARYDEWLSRSGVTTPPTLPYNRHIYHQYTIRVPDGRRDALAAHLRKSDIGCKVYYPVGLHEQPCFSGLGGRRGDQPNCERAASEVLSLPMYPEITVEMQRYVADRISSFLKA